MAKAQHTKGRGIRDELRRRQTMSVREKGLDFILRQRGDEEGCGFGVTSLNTVRFYSSLISLSVGGHVRVDVTPCGWMSLPAVIPPYDSTPFQVLSAPSIQAAGTERGCGGWHGSFPGPRPGSHTLLPGFGHMGLVPYRKRGWEMSPGYPREEA